MIEHKVVTNPRTADPVRCGRYLRPVRLVAAFRAAFPGAEVDVDRAKRWVPGDRPKVPVSAQAE